MSNEVYYDLLNSMTQNELSEDHEDKDLSPIISAAVIPPMPAEMPNHGEIKTEEISEEMQNNFILPNKKRKEKYNSSLLAFLSGFYQKDANEHIFFQLSYDDVCRIAEFAKNWKVFPYTEDIDALGIINWIGCLGDGRTYVNPITQDMIRILTSRDYYVNYFQNEGKTYTSIYRILEYPSLTDKDCYFDPGCIVFYFPNHMIHPMGYTFRNGGGRGSVMKKWTLEASNSINGPWITLRNHSEDDTFFSDVIDNNKENSFLSHSWEIRLPNSQKDFYSYFKLQSLQTHPNGSSRALYISGFELYGIVRWN